ncbi:MAG: hypothetical protein PHH47_13530 [Gallionella sp.]|nr:hypothetical protein [Gallionella sp.]MDD4947900.1 hypothetical protein [Gallionella sp.]
MATGNPRGRPKKDKAERVPHGYSFRLNDADDAEFQSQISRSGLNESEYIRRAVVKNETTIIGDAGGKKRITRIAKPSNPDSRRLLFLAAQTSNNCNQLAHAINTAKKSKGGISEKLVESVLQELEQIKQLAKGWLE